MHDIYRINHAFFKFSINQLPFRVIKINNLHQYDRVATTLVNPADVEKMGSDKNYNTAANPVCCRKFVTNIYHFCSKF